MNKKNFVVLMALAAILCFASVAGATSYPTMCKSAECSEESCRCNEYFDENDYFPGRYRARTEDPYGVFDWFNFLMPEWQWFDIQDTHPHFHDTFIGMDPLAIDDEDTDAFESRVTLYSPFYNFHEITVPESVDEQIQIQAEPIDFDVQQEQTSEESVNIEKEKYNDFDMIVELLKLLEKFQGSSSVSIDFQNGNITYLDISVY